MPSHNPKCWSGIEICVHVYCNGMARNSNTAWAKEVIISEAVWDEVDKKNRERKERSICRSNKMMMMMMRHWSDEAIQRVCHPISRHKRKPVYNGALLLALSLKIYLALNLRPFVSIAVLSKALICYFSVNSFKADTDKKTGTASWLFAH